MISSFFYVWYLRVVYLCIRLTV